MSFASFLSKQVSWAAGCLIGRGIDALRSRPVDARQLRKELPKRAVQAYELGQTTLRDTVYAMCITTSADPEFPCISDEFLTNPWGIAVDGIPLLAHELHQILEHPHADAEAVVRQSRKLAAFFSRSRK